MKIKRLARRSSWDPQRVSMLGVNSNTLGLILVNARENIERELQDPNRRSMALTMQSLLEVIKKIEDFINADDPWMRDEDVFED